jgi:hypothetical protein
MLKWAIVPDRGDQTTGDLRGRQCNAQAAGISSAKNDERPFKYPRRRGELADDRRRRTGEARSCLCTSKRES